MVAKYAHKKLDARHVQDRIFDKLNCNMLVAGELEIASLEEISSSERKARINIAKTLCYHKKYLKDEDLQSGYNFILKKVEQGLLTWDDELGNKLHEHLDYQANVILHDKLQAKKDSEGFSKVENRKSLEKKSSDDRG